MTSHVHRDQRLDRASLIASRPGRSPLPARADLGLSCSGRPAGLAQVPPYFAQPISEASMTSATSQAETAVDGRTGRSYLSGGLLVAGGVWALVGNVLHPRFDQQNQA